MILLATYKNISWQHDEEYRYSMHLGYLIKN